MPSPAVHDQEPFDPARVRVRISASAGERFGPNAFASQVGTTISIGTTERPVTGRLVAVTVTDDGRTAVLVIALCPNT